MSDAALEPKLTAFDRRVLEALDECDWSMPRSSWDHEWRSPWQVAERLRHDDVAEVRRILRGLGALGYTVSTGWGHRQVWLREERGTGAIKEAKRA